MQKIEYYTVNTEYDRSSTLIGHFSNREAAEAVKGTDMYRAVYGPQVFTVFDTVAEFEDNSRAKIRERALAKLTTEEKIVLGIGG